MMQPWQRDLLAAMPKAELHLHLDGAMTVSLAIELGGGNAPQRWSELHRRLKVQTALSSQAELLRYFDFPCALMQSAGALRRTAAALVEQKLADNVRYAEIRFGPRLHVGPEFDLAGVFEAVLRGIEDGKRGRTDVAFPLIATALRAHSVEDNIAMLEAGRAFLGRGLVAADLAGIEHLNPDPVDQLAYFERARELGYHITFHTGEVPHNAAVIRRAAEAIRPERIAHGSPAVEDEALCAALAERGIMLDLCPTSNLQAGLWPSYAEYPICELRRCGIAVSINTDQSAISDLSLTDEYAHLLEHCGLSLRELWELNLGALDRGFADQGVRDALKRDFLQFAAGVAELQGEQGNCAGGNSK